MSRVVFKVSDEEYKRLRKSTDELRKSFQALSVGLRKASKEFSDSFMVFAERMSKLNKRKHDDEQVGRDPL